MTASEKLTNCIEVLNACIKNKARNNLSERIVVIRKGNEEMKFDNQKECGYFLEVSSQMVSQSIKSGAEIKGWEVRKWID